MPEIQLKASELREGDLVDLQDDPFADPNNAPYFECEYVCVISVERETNECVCVYFDDTDAIGFPAAHMLKVVRD